jgi:TRAP-type C4-dicarboxylate transport system permease large subunit
LILYPRPRFPIDFGIRVDEIVERITALLGSELDVAAFRKFDAVSVMCSKKYSRLDGSFAASAASTGHVAIEGELSNEYKRELAVGGQKTTLAHRVWESA